MPHFILARHLYPHIPISRRDFLRSVRQLLYRTRHPRRRPTAQQDRQQNPPASHQQRRRTDPPHQLHIRPPRIANQQDREHRTIRASVRALERDRVKYFAIGPILRPLDRAGHFLFGLPHGIDQWFQLLGRPCVLPSRLGRIHQQLHREAIPAILIQQGPRARRHIQSREKTLIQTEPAYHVNRTFPHARRTHREQTQGRSILQFFLPQKCSLTRRGGKAANCTFRVAKLGRPLRGGNGGSIAFHKLQKVELTILRGGFGQLEERARIRRFLIQSHRHAARGFRHRNGLHSPRHILALPVELPTELRHQRRRPFVLTAIEGAPRHGRHQPRHRRHGQKHRECEHAQQFAAKHHGFLPIETRFCTMPPNRLHHNPPLSFAAVKACSRWRSWFRSGL